MRDLVRDLARRGLRRVLWKEGGLGETVGGGAEDCIFDRFGEEEEVLWLVWFCLGNGYSFRNGEGGVRFGDGGRIDGVV